MARHLPFWPGRAYRCFVFLLRRWSLRWNRKPAPALNPEACAEHNRRSGKGIVKRDAGTTSFAKERRDAAHSKERRRISKGEADTLTIERPVCSAPPLGDKSGRG